MAEYFVARALVRELCTDHEAARSLLSSVILGPEIVDFVTLLMNKNEQADEMGRTLAGFARSAVTGNNSGYLGGNSITLTYRSRWRPRQHHWADLDLDYADLSGADLAGADFSASSLRYSTFDNADLSNADLTDCNLNGARLEETAPVISVAPGRTESSVIACYGDGTIREWQLSGSRPASKNLLDGIKGLRSAAWGPHGELIVIAGPGLSLWEITEGSRVERHTFPIRSGTDYVRFRYGTVSFVRADADQYTARSVDCENGLATVVPLTHRGPVAFAGRETIAMPLAADTVGVVRLNEPDSTPSKVAAADLAAIDARGGTGAVELMLTDSKGHVMVLKVPVHGTVPETGAVTAQELHEGPVPAAAFLSQRLVATGGVDRSLVVSEWDGGQIRVLHRLKLTLRCAGIRTAGVQGETERRFLEELRDRAEETDPQC